MGLVGLSLSGVRNALYRPLLSKTQSANASDGQLSLLTLSIPLSLSTRTGKNRLRMNLKWRRCGSTPTTSSQAALFLPFHPSSRPSWQQLDAQRNLSLVHRLVDQRASSCALLPLSTCATMQQVSSAGQRVARASRRSSARAVLL